MTDKKLLETIKKMSEEEYQQFELTLEIIKARDCICKANKNDYCDLIHTTLKRNQNNEIVEVVVYCDKQVKKMKWRNLLFNNMTETTKNNLDQELKTIFNKHNNTFLKLRQSYYLETNYLIDKESYLLETVNLLIDNDKKTAIVDFEKLHKDIIKYWELKDYETIERMISKIKESDYIIINNFGFETKHKTIFRDYTLDLLKYFHLTKKAVLFSSSMNLEDISKYYSKIDYYELKRLKEYLFSIIKNNIVVVKKQESN